ncbi:CHAT domain-containing protein [Streptomyces avermitilis]|uniref:CHAT domain-containing protein n=1 Tax=Streptomyces avermitilis TaxID=33903 RepID=UPI0037F88191
MAEAMVTANLDGAVVLADDFARLAGLNHPDGQFAFVAACHTAVGSLGVPDEMISFATALSHGGFRNVIGTLWSVGDYQASLVTQG